MKSSSFEILVSSPAGWSHPGLASSAAKAGTTGILDAVFCQDPAHFQNQALRLLSSIPNGGRIGFKIRPDQSSWIEVLKEPLQSLSHTLIVEACSPQGLPKASSLAVGERRLLAELPFVPKSEDLGFLEGWHGIVLPGSEAAGFCGKQSSLLNVLQVSSLPMPVYVRGGISRETTAACRVGGAAGVIVEEAAWLLPDSPLDERQKMALRALSGEETRTVGSASSLRAWIHPTFAHTDELNRLSDPSSEPRSDTEKDLEIFRNRFVGWGSPAENIWPVGQTIGLASSCAAKYTNLSHLVHDWETAADTLPSIASRESYLGAESTLSSRLGLRAGIVQGPMTRVSDVPAFAASVSKGGAMPTLALALLNKKRSQELLRETSERLGDQPWGVGILGFVPAELQEEQIEAILEFKPPFVIIAGGRPEQAERLEAEGITTFLHVPTPALLSIFLKQGARRFIFEGRECGGHVGPLSSFVLWSRMVDTLLEEVSDPAGVDILFAGGVHDALSAAMATTVAAPLLEKGFSWGVLIGTPYLFTKEATEDGAITPSYQEQALVCTETVCLPVAPGHANRCVPTQFAEDFLNRRRQLLSENAPADTVRAELEALTLGRLRAATKGLERNADGDLVNLTAEEQLSRGMFMIGETATLRHQITDIDTLHQEIVRGSFDHLTDFASDPPVETLESEPPVDIAVVGISTFLPDAADKDALWKNLLDRHVAVREIPKSRWDTRLHYDPDPNAPGKTNSRWGGFFPDVPVDLAKLGIPPSSARHMSTSNLLCLEAARLALADAGYDRRPFDRENTAVILANADGGGHLGHALIVRSLLGLFDPDTDPEVFERMPPIKEESLPGTLTNVVAGRISNRMDLGGPNYTVDAACASSLATIDLAARELNSRRSNVVLAGASEIVMGPPAYVAFSKVGALSGTGKVRPFDQSADGIALSDGIVFLVLKRLEDAERDGDRIYSVIKGVGGSSDGKALGMTAPRPLGQKRALKRAYANAGYSPATIGFYEAHATGTPVGDSAELETIIESLRAEGAGPDSCVISSSKGVLGHSRTSAGMAALVKSVLALHYKVLPPLSSVSKPLPGLDDPDTPVNVRRTPHPWIHSGSVPRRAGVSAFGFGGTNFHVALEEYTHEAAPRSPGGSRWPSELVLIGGRDDSELKANADRWLAALAADPSLKLADIAFTSTLGTCNRGFAAIVTSHGDLSECLRLISTEGFAAKHQRLISRREDSEQSGKIAFLFPGQASQNVDMAGEAALFLQPLREVLEMVDRIGASTETGPLSRHIYPPTAFTPEKLRDQKNRLARTEIAQPAIGAISLGFLKALQDLGIQPDVTAGHSYGEIPALVAAGRMSVEDALQHSFLRGQAMSQCPSGSMAAVHSAPDEIREILSGFPDLVIANHNAPRQVVVAGPVEPLEALVEKLNSEGIRSSLLPVSGAFHSPLMESAREQWGPSIPRIHWTPSTTPVYSAVTQDYYSTDPEAAGSLLLDQLTQPVSFVGTVNRFYDEGVRTFVEVGPRNILSNLTEQILKGRDHRCVILDDEGTGLSGFLRGIASLWAEGRNVDFCQLFSGRRVNRIEVDRLARQPAYQPSPTTWLINSSFVRKSEDEDGRYGSLPLLTLEERDEARKAAAARKASTPDAQPSPARPSSASPAIPQQAYAAYQETMREFLRLQETVMRQFASGTVPANPAAPASYVPPTMPKASSPTPKESSPALEPEAAPAPVETGSKTPLEKPLNKWTEDELLTFVTDIVSEKTGYPPEMLGPDQDMEADLGIDSIKRIEILDVIQEKFSVAGDARALVRALGKKKTLREIASSTLNFDTGEVESAAIPPLVPERSPEPAARSTKESKPSPSFGIEERDAPLSTPIPLPLNGLILVTEDESGIAEKLIELLEESGASGFLIPRSALSSESALIPLVNDAREAAGPVRGIVHLAAFSQDPIPQEWEQNLTSDVLSIFSLLRHCSDDLQQTGDRTLGRILTVSSMGGSFGRGKESPGNLLSGAGVGIIKTLDLEWPNVFAKAVDFAKDDAPETIASRCFDELRYSTNQTEVGYPDGNRKIFVPVRQPEPTVKAHRFQPGEVVVATGGARGITAKCLQPLVGPGVSVFLFGRSPRDPARLAPFARCEGLSEIRKKILSDEKLRPAGAGPAEIETLALRILQAREMEANLRDLEASGASVEYIALDITDSDSLRGALRKIRREKKEIHHFIHGAGVLADNLVEKKTETDLKRVIQTKISCLPVIAEELKDPKSLVLFGSVSGRFGNFGQSDYAAANEVLNRFAHFYQRAHPETRVLALNWGPWADGGMANPAVLQKLRQRGIDPIQPEEGVEFLARKLAEPPSDPELVVGTGPWAEDEIDLEGAFDAGLFLLESNASFHS